MIYLGVHCAINTCQYTVQYIVYEYDCAFRIISGSVDSFTV